MTKDKYYKAFGVHYFLFELEDGTFFFTRKEGFTQSKKEAIEMQHWNDLEIKKPSKDLIAICNELRQKALEGTLVAYKDSETYQNLKREQWKTGLRIFFPKEQHGYFTPPKKFD